MCCERLRVWAVLMVIILGADERTIFAQFLHPKKVTVCIICVFPTIAYAFMGGSRDVKDLCKINRSPIYKRLKHVIESEPHPRFRAFRGPMGADVLLSSTHVHHALMI